ncbi:hypothetical protein SDC9_148979 [bioreactor metagenome]|uniref:Uncharacterized protein n=1 Tax=bioreactor metagenome TaxID=1076179 RepID=A0A645EJ38_9ZZZZ
MKLSAVILKRLLGIAKKVPIQVITERRCYREPVRGDGGDDKRTGIGSGGHELIVTVAQGYPLDCGKRIIAVDLGLVRAYIEAGNLAIQAACDGQGPAPSNAR